MHPIRLQAVGQLEGGSLKFKSSEVGQAVTEFRCEKLKRLLQARKMVRARSFRARSAPILLAIDYREGSPEFRCFSGGVEYSTS